jgi:aquaporin Z
MTARALAAELIGTFVVVLATCAAYLGTAPVTPLGLALAAGLSYLTMAAALAPVSGGHFNPAVTVGLVAAGRCDPGRLVGYIVAQTLGALAAVWLLQAVLAGMPLTAPRPATHAVFAAAANTYSEARGVSLAAALAVEITATAVMVLAIVCASARKAEAAIAPLVAGAAVTVMYLVAIPFTNASLNPARSTGPALMSGGVPMAQLWVFWAAPIAGGLIGGAIGRWLAGEDG